MACCGTQGGYVRGCRCDACRAAQAAYMREYRAARRRLREARTGALRDASARVWAQQVVAQGAL